MLAGAGAATAPSPAVLGADAAATTGPALLPPPPSGLRAAPTRPSSAATPHPPPAVRVVVVATAPAAMPYPYLYPYCRCPRCCYQPLEIALLLHLLLLPRLAQELTPGAPPPPTAAAVGDPAPAVGRRHRPAHPPSLSGHPLKLAAAPPLLQGLEEALTVAVVVAVAVALRLPTVRRGVNNARSPPLPPYCQGVRPLSHEVCKRLTIGETL